jgi:hypothetical protein
MVIKKFQSPYDKSPFFDGDCSFRSPTQGACQMFLESPIQKLMTRPPFVGIKKFQLISNGGGVLEGNQIFFYRHFTHPHWTLATNCPLVTKNLVTIE